MILLKDFDGRRHEEIGVLLNPIRSRICRARLNLRKHLRLLVEQAEERLVEAAEKAVNE